MSHLNSVALRAAALCTTATVGIACVGTAVLLDKAWSHSHAALQHRVDLLEQDVGHLEQRVVKLEDVLAEALNVQTATSGKSATATAKPAEEQPAALTIPIRPVKRKATSRPRAHEGSDYPQMKMPYPWAEWESPAPAQQ